MAVFIIFALLITSLFTFRMSTTGQFVPALFIFGDSIVDTGNNNQLPTLIKANFPPYGRDYVNQQPTGRFSNGKLAIDIIADSFLALSSLPPAYLTDEAKGRNLLVGANFASAGSGYYNLTANLNLAISLDQQLEYFKEFQAKLVGMVGETNASSIIAGSLYIISSGSSDFLQNYYINPLLQLTNQIDQFFAILLQNFVAFIQVSLKSPMTTS
ncbi:Lipase, GDSL, active site [Trema orientale]|uniref:Lipase, GDSL, active site n=1 Tax=Trema orientale TaxID=63057 RepID=A0A2P5ASR0_TREOI|nr:Lipase, GDSL, active site [Trema orientale]